jgi:hypothetical protein
MIRNHENYITHQELYNHVGDAGDPHPQYITEARMGAWFTNAGFRSMAYQSSNNVNITGGTITGVNGLLTGAVPVAQQTTANVTNGVLTVGTVQNIGTGSSPQFANVIVTNNPTISTHAANKGWVEAQITSALANSIDNPYLVTTSGLTTALSNYVLKTTTIATQGALSGGGALTGNLTLTVASATNSVVGVARFATDNEVTAGTSTTTMLTPKNLVDKLTAYGIGPLASTTAAGRVELADANETVSGSSSSTNPVVLTLGGVAEAIQRHSYISLNTSGTASAFTASFTPTLPTGDSAFAPPLVLVKFHTAPTNNATLNGLAITHPSGAAIRTGELVANVAYPFFYTGSAFIMHTIVPAYRGTQLTITQNKTIPINAWTNIAWDQTNYGNDGTDVFWSDTVPTRILIPSGVTRIEVVLQMMFQNADAQFIDAQIINTTNNAAKTPAHSNYGNPGRYSFINLTSGPMDVTPADQLNVQVYHNGTTSILGVSGARFYCDIRILK